MLLRRVQVREQLFAAERLQAFARQARPARRLLLARTGAAVVRARRASNRLAVDAVAVGGRQAVLAEAQPEQERFRRGRDPRSTARGGSRARGRGSGATPRRCSRRRSGRGWRRGRWRTRARRGWRGKGRLGTCPRRRSASRTRGARSPACRCAERPSRRSSAFPAPPRPRRAPPAGRRARLLGRGCKSKPSKRSASGLKNTAPPSRYLTLPEGLCGKMSLPAW